MHISVFTAQWGWSILKSIDQNSESCGQLSTVTVVSMTVLFFTLLKPITIPGITVPQAVLNHWGSDQLIDSGHC